MERPTYKSEMISYSVVNSSLDQNQSLMMKFVQSILFLYVQSY